MMNVHFSFLFVVGAFMGTSFIFSQGLDYENDWAVVVGINDYANDEIADLNYAVSDAEDIRGMLIEYFGFKDDNIVSLINEQATAINIKREISGLAKKTGENDRIVIFFAGHGMTEDLPSGGEMGYLVPYDGDLEDLYLTSIPMKELRNLSDRFDAKHVLFLVDACYGGLAAVGTRGLSTKIAGYYDKIFRGKSRQIITAGGKGETVIEKADWGHSAFTYNLLRGLKDWMADLDNDGYITGEEIGIYLKKRVTEDSELHQTPTIGRFTTDQGEVLFKRPSQLGEAFIPEVASGMPIINPTPKVPKLEPLPKPSSKNIKTAKMLSVAFPGTGHFYMGDNKKGLLWSGLGAAGLLGTIAMAGEYQTNNDNFQAAKSLFASYDGNDLAEFEFYEDQMISWNDKTSASQTNLMVFGGIYLGVVVANYFNLNAQGEHFSNQKISIGANSEKQVLIKYNF